jgi:hypothetical protein
MVHRDADERVVDVVTECWAQTRNPLFPYLDTRLMRVRGSREEDLSGPGLASGGKLITEM